MTDPFPGGSSGGNSSQGSGLRESLLKTRIAKLPHLPAIAPGRKQKEVEEDGEEEEENDGLGSLSMTNPKPSKSKLRSVHAIDEYSPISAVDCFQEALEVDIDDESDTNVQSTNLSGDKAFEQDKSRRNNTIFRVYFTPPQISQKKKTRPTLSAIEESQIGNPPLLSKPSLQGAQDDDEDEDEEEDDEETSPTIFLLHHGAGYSALSFALFAKNITQQTNGKVGVLAYDCRGHGKTAHPNDSDSNNLSLDRLTKDGLAILSKLFPSEKKQPTLILIGHSMGGAVVVSMAHALMDKANDQDRRPRVAGVAVLDVVEGTAMAALPNMKTIVSNLPKGFRSIEDAIQWHIESGTIINPQSARRSVSSLLKKNDLYDPQTHQDEQDEEPMEEITTTNDSNETQQENQDPSQFPFVWRHDLLATEPHWSGWFKGLSDSFLKVRCAKLLLLAGTDRLDKDLMIGQMQGKYQLVVFPDVGHSLQEDAPQRTAQTLVDFWKRNEMVDTKTIKALRKVGQP